jgi:hypothetical protein
VRRAKTRGDPPRPRKTATPSAAPAELPAARVMRGPAAGRTDRRQQPTRRCIRRGHPIPAPND